MNKIQKSTLLSVFSLTIATGHGVDIPLLDVEIDFSHTNGAIRALHGVNKGPLASGGTIDLTEAYRASQIPFVRLHDCMWPYPDVVDVHAIFRNPSADPEDPLSYDFTLTDEYLAAVHRTSAKIIYRLGESIEHMNTKRFVHPPPDPKKWSQTVSGSFGTTTTVGPAGFITEFNISRFGTSLRTGLPCGLARTNNSWSFTVLPRQK